MKQLITGRVASGKRYLADRLALHNLTIAKLYTTCPEYKDDNTKYIFVSPEKASNIPDKIAEMKIDGYDYFFTAEEIKKADIIITDPDGVFSIAEALPDIAFNLIYIMATAKDRKANLITHASNKENAIKFFEKHNSEENETFLNFENHIGANINNNNQPIILQDLWNISSVYKITNKATNGSYNPYIFDDMIESIVGYIRQNRAMLNIIESSICAGILTIDANNPERIITFTETPTDLVPHSVSKDVFINLLLNNNTQFTIFIKDWLAKVYYKSGN